jgi:hypothetical protein
LAYISGAVEGPSDEVVLRRIVNGRGADVHRVQIQNGKTNLRRALPGYNDAAQSDPWLVLVDLDQDFECPAALVTEWLPAPSAFMRFRVVVRQIEAWLLADAERFASFFALRRAAIPDIPDQLPDAKAALLTVIASSRRSAIRKDMVPRPGSCRRVGPAYTSRLIEFASNADEGWRPDVAANRSPSLASCLARLDQLIEIAP